MQSVTFWPAKFPELEAIFPTRNLLLFCRRNPFSSLIAIPISTLTFRMCLFILEALLPL